MTRGSPKSPSSGNASRSSGSQSDLSPSSRSNASAKPSRKAKGRDEDPVAEKPGKRSVKRILVGACPASVWILPTHLNPAISSLKGLPRETPVVMVESFEDLSTQPAHKQKLVLLLAAMRHFRDELSEKGYRVDYYALDDRSPKRRQLAQGTCLDCLKNHLESSRSGTIRVARPADYETFERISTLNGSLGACLEITPNNLFLTEEKDFGQCEDRQNEMGMETFYRGIRGRLDVLMEGNFPVGGRWNYDVENRVPPMENMEIPPLEWTEQDAITKKVIALVEERFPNQPGETKNFGYPVTRKGYDRWFNRFVEDRLKLFGIYQDAMVRESPILYHSLISPGMNIGLLEPLACVRKVEEAYRHGDAPINSAEGFIRQVIGWREYVYGTYWNRMPAYREMNYFGHDLELPEMFLSGNTRMACVREVVLQCLNLGYAHHIQRLMIIGNMALLLGVSPLSLVDWFMSMTVDAGEWAVIPNVFGTILYADGGFFGSRPYAASANYIGKMSNYCRNCYYKGRKRVGDRACPLNFLYWYFLKQNESLLRKNKRMTMVYNLLDRKSESEMELVIRSSRDFLQQTVENGTDRKARK